MVAIRQYKNYINGSWVNSQGGFTFENKNPATQVMLGSYPNSTEDDVALAVDTAKSMLSVWGQVTPPKRGKILFDIARKLEENRDKLADVIVKEMGKTKKEALGEVNSGIDMCNFMAGEGRRMYGEVTPSELNNRLAMVKRYPVGVAGIITPWNFPFSMMSWKVFPALICGNTVVLKPSSQTPETAHLFAEILHASALPKGVFNMVHGDGHTGAHLVRNKDVNVVSFTGSTAVGKEIAKVCGERLCKVSLELGGKNAVIVLDDANLDLAVDSCVKGAFTVAGQRCSATSRVIVHRSVYDKFLLKLIEATQKLKVGAGSNESVDVCPVITPDKASEIENVIAKAQQSGSNLVYGGKRITGSYIRPTIFECQPESFLAQDELFAPILCVLKCESLDHAITIANNTKYGLSGSIFTKDINKALYAMDKLQVGVFYVNAPTYGAECHLSFGGLKQSGNGHREVGKSAIDVFTELKTIYLDYSGMMQNVQSIRKD